MRFASLLAALLFAAPAWAQTTIYQQSFEDGDPAYTASLECNDGDNDFFTRTDTTDVSDDYQISGFDGDFIFAAQDIDDTTDCAGTGNLPQRISFDDIDISGFTSLSFAGLFAEDTANDSAEDWDAPDFVHVKYRIDSDDDDDLVNLIWFENDGSTFNSAPFQDTDFDGTGDGTELTDMLSEFSAAIAGTGSTLDIVILFSLDSGDEDIAVDNIRISGEMEVATEPEIDVDPTSVDFGTVEVGMSAQRTVTISNTGDGDLTITSIALDAEDSFSIVSGDDTGVIAPGGTQDVVIQFAPTSAGPTSGSGLFIGSDDADEPSVQVALSGNGEDPVDPEPEIDVDPTSLAFGTVTVGSSSQMTVTISNTGDAALTLSSVGVTGAGFSLVGTAPPSVAAGGSEDVTVEFAPASAGAASGTLTIMSDDADEATVEVALSGTGDEPSGACDYAFEAAAMSSLSFGSDGGQARFAFAIDNSTNASSASVDVWARVTDSEGNTVFVRTPRSETIPASSFYKAGYNQRIPASTADGTYTYTLMAGTYDAENPSESEICGSETFTITKGTDTTLGKATSPLLASDWAGTEIVGVEITEAALRVSGDEIRVGPNPTRGATTFAFALAEDGEVSLALYDVQGREVATVVSGPMRAGSHTAALTETLAPGVYVWQLRAGDRVESGRLTVVR